MHDPLCPLVGVEFVSGELCDSCDLIARVREDERAAALRDAVEAVKALPWTHEMWAVVDDRGVVIAAIEALGGERFITTNDHLVACAYRGWPSMPCDCGLEPQ